MAAKFEILYLYSEPIKTRLYNLTADPFEKNNLANQMVDVVESLKNRLKKYFKTMIPPDIAPEIIDGNPNRYEIFVRKRALVKYQSQSTVI